jgi:hypothetical protein
MTEAEGPALPVSEPNLGSDALPKRPRSQPKRTYSKHGLVTLKATVRQLGPRVIDRRTTLGKQLASWRADLIRDLGGDVSTQQAAVIDLAVKTRLLLDSIDAWLLVQPSLVNARKKALLPVVRERQQLADALARYMTALGLERKAREAPSLHEYLAERSQQTEPVQPAGGGDGDETAPEMRHNASESR